MTKYESVKAFHKAFQLAAPERPTMPSDNLLHFRWKLTDEENCEKRYSLSLADYLDAIADLLYLVNGDAVAAGITEAQLDRAFREVHESNMSKMWSSDEMCDVEPEFWIDHSATEGAFGPCEPHVKGWVVKNKLGKVVKSPSYRPVNLSWIENGK